jgi:hypothetical protein
LVCDYESSGGEEEEPKKPSHVAMKTISTTPEDEEPDEEEEPEHDLPALPFLLDDPPKKKEVDVITLNDMVSPAQSSPGKCDFVYFQIDDCFAPPPPRAPRRRWPWRNL